MEEARTVGASVLSEEEHRLAARESSYTTVPTAAPISFLRADRSRLVAHVGAVGQVVAAVQPSEQRIAIRGLQAGAARRVEDHRLRIERAQLPADRRKGFVPTARYVMVSLRDRSAADGSGGPAARDRSRAIRGARSPCASRINRDRSGDWSSPTGSPSRRSRRTRRVVVRGLGPGAGDAHETARFVLTHQGVERRRGDPSTPCPRYSRYP